LLFAVARKLAGVDTDAAFVCLEKEHDGRKVGLRFGRYEVLRLFRDISADQPRLATDAGKEAIGERLQLSPHGLTKGHRLLVDPDDIDLKPLIRAYHQKKEQWKAMRDPVISRLLDLFIKETSRR
jgi:hypothetical protein